MSELSDYLRFIFIAYLTIVVCNTVSASTLSLTSPDGNYNFKLENHANGSGTYSLIKHGKSLWNEPGENRDVLVAAWSGNSKHLIYVQGNRFSFKLLTIQGAAIAVTKLDEEPLLKMGASLIPYDWNAANQGSIPHDLVLEIKQLEAETFGGIYLRAKYPNRVVIPFKVKVTDLPVGSIQTQYQFGKPLRLQKWSEKIPTWNKLQF